MVRRMIPLALVAMLAVGLPVHGQTVQPTKIAVANTAQIFSQMQETKDLNVKINNQMRSLKAEAQRRQADLENLRNTRDQFKSDSPQWTQANEKLLKATVDDRSWQELNQLDQQRQQKLQTKQIFDKIQEECGKIAQQMGYDVVLAQQTPELVKAIEDPNTNIQEFLSRMALYNVLYASSKVDITDKVIAALDAQYHASGGGSTATPAPAPSAK